MNHTAHTPRHITRTSVLSAAVAALAASVVTLAPTAGAEAFRTTQPTVSTSTARNNAPVAGQATQFGTTRTRTTTTKAAMLGTPRSGLPWHSGFYTDVEMSTTQMRAMEAWTAHPSDIMTVYPSYNTWDEMANSGWVTQLSTGFEGHLSYGLPLLPWDRAGQWSDVTNGSHDYVFRAIAQQLLAAGRGDTPIRVGLEANGDWFPWGIKSTADIAKYKAAFQRVVTVMRAVAPKLTFWFDTSSGVILPGQTNRLDSLNLLYPGDAYVNGISMDHYDTKWFPSATLTQFQATLKPTQSAGLADAAAFARARGKAFAVPEWGLRSATTSYGNGDNPVFIQGMYTFFQTNKDILVWEAYFNESDPYIACSLYGPTQMPKAAAMYLQLF